MECGALGVCIGSDRGHGYFLAKEQLFRTLDDVNPDPVLAELEASVIICGGVGNFSHLAEGLKDARVDAVATANLLNFMGDGLGSARSQLVSLGIDLPIFNLH